MSEIIPEDAVNQCSARNSTDAKKRFVFSIMIYGGLGKGKGGEDGFHYNE